MHAADLLLNQFVRSSLRPCDTEEEASGQRVKVGRNDSVAAAT